MNGRATRAMRWAARGIASWSREGRRGRASEAEGVASVRDRRHVCVCGRCARARAGAGRMRAPPALELDLLVRRAAQGRSRPRGAQGAGRGRRPPPRKPLRSAVYWTCAGRCTIPGSCERLVALPAGHMQARCECIDLIMTAAATDACCHPTSKWRSLRWLRTTPQAPLGLLRRALSCLTQSRSPTCRHADAYCVLRTHAKHRPETPRAASMHAPTMCRKARP